MSQSKEQFIDMREAEEAKSTGLSITTAKFLDLDKGSIREMAMAITDEYKDGFKSPAELLLLSKKLEEFATQIKENIKDEAANELKLGKGEKGNVHGATVTEQMTGVRYDFSTSSDPIWNDLNTRIKEREAYLKTIKGSKEEYLPDTQEVVTIFEPTKSGSLSLIFKY